MTGAHEAEPQLLTDAVRRHARLRPEKLAFICDDRTSTFSEFDLRTSRVANALIGDAVTNGAHFAYLCKNSDRVFEVFYGGLKAGAVPVGVNWRLSPAEAGYILRDSDSRLVFTDQENLALARAAAAQAPSVTRILLLDSASLEEAGNYVAWRDRHGEADPARDGAQTPVACQLYTSGTTGNPKGVQLTHANFLAQRHSAARSGPWMNAAPAEIVLVVMPVYHIGGLSMGTIAFQQGVTTIVSAMTGPAMLLDTIERFQVTYSFLVPAVLQALIDHPECTKHRLRSLRVVRYGAAPISAALLRRVRAMLSCQLVQVYGTTESCGSVTCLPPDDHNEAEAGNRMRSCGKPLAGIEIAILDQAGLPTTPGGVGEICVRGPSVMAGYWRQPEATQQAWHDSWYRTGDAGYLDQDGYLFLHDRIKDMIVSGGENIYPAEVEHAICDHPSVQEAAVIGVPDAHWGEAVKAIIVLRAGTDLSGADLADFLRGRVARFKVPKSFEFVSTLPRNPSGKILRRQLREPYWQGHGRFIS